MICRKPFQSSEAGKAKLNVIFSGRKKLRLYEYLHQALNDPNMGDSIQWIDSSSGTFHFISKNKEKLAECWGQRKGNRKTMTYQKMARALRNYSRTGEIIKVRRKLTYQFNPDILNRLGSTQVNGHLPCHSAQDGLHPQQPDHSDQSYCPSAAAEWHSWCGHYPLQEDYDLSSSFTSHSSTKPWTTHGQRPVRCVGNTACWDERKIMYNEKWDMLGLNCKVQSISKLYWPYTTLSKTCYIVSYIVMDVGKCNSFYSWRFFFYPQRIYLQAN